MFEINLNKHTKNHSKFCYTAKSLIGACPLGPHTSQLSGFPHTGAEKRKEKTTHCTGVRGDGLFHSLEKCWCKAFTLGPSQDGASPLPGSLRSILLQQVQHETRTKAIQRKKSKTPFPFCGSLSSSFSLISPTALYHLHTTLNLTHF